jgi:hypothetical protein
MCLQCGHDFCAAPQRTLVATASWLHGCWRTVYSPARGTASLVACRAAITQFAHGAAPCDCAAGGAASAAVLLKSKAAITVDTMNFCMTLLLDEQRDLRCLEAYRRRSHKRDRDASPVTIGQ